MINIKCTISYDGAKFNGFYAKENSIATKIKYALKSLNLKDDFTISGRTDKGVHALYQVLNFKTNLKFDLKKLQFLLNERLNPYIYVLEVNEVDENFHARFSAKYRIYKYYCSSDYVLPFFSDYISNIEIKDFKKTCNAVNLFIGKHNFRLFKKTRSNLGSDIRTIYFANCQMKILDSKKIFCFTFVANGFLRSQIRLMISAIAKYSNDEINIETLKAQIDNKLEINESIRNLAPPNGLYLYKIIY